MPLDSHSFLVSQGWGGKGTGLRQGAINRPLAIPQKKTLAGLGKDRDEAFPFWDHLFSAASKSIQIKCISDDEEEEDKNTTDASSVNPSTNTTSIKYTSTGIFSNRRPIAGTPATSSGTNTPENPAAAPSHHQLGLLATAKRDAAKRGLYSKFFRGPVLGPDTIIEEEKRLAALVSKAFLANDSIVSLTLQETVEIQPIEHRDKPEDTEANSCTLNKSSLSPISGKDQKEKNRVSANAIDDHESQTDRKRRKEEKKRLKKRQKVSDKTHSNSENQTEPEEIISTYTAPVILDDLKKRKRKRKHADTDHESQAERKRRKEEKKRLKVLAMEKTNSNSGNQTKPEETGIALELQDEPKKRKKKRKYADVE